VLGFILYGLTGSKTLGVVAGLAPIIAVTCFFASFGGSSFGSILLSILQPPS